MFEQLDATEALMDYLTPGQVAELLNVDRTTVWRWIKDGHFKDVRRKGFGPTSPHLIPVESVKAVADQLGADIDLDEVNESE